MWTDVARTLVLGPLGKATRMTASTVRCRDASVLRILTGLVMAPSVVALAVVLVATDVGSDKSSDPRLASDQHIHFTV